MSSAAFCASQPKVAIVSFSQLASEDNSSPSALTDSTLRAYAPAAPTRSSDSRTEVRISWRSTTARPAITRKDIPDRNRGMDFSSSEIKPNPAKHDVAAALQPSSVSMYRQSDPAAQVRSRSLNTSPIARSTFIGNQAQSSQT